MGLGPVDGVVLPPAGLLDADSAPLLLGEETGFGEGFGQLFRKDYVTVLVLSVGIFLCLFEGRDLEEGKEGLGLEFIDKGR